MDTTNPILVAVNTWTQSLNSPLELINYLNQGTCFEITRNDYTTWKDITGVTALHAYPAVFEDTLKFVVVDNITDANPDIQWRNVKTVPYTFGSDQTVIVQFVDTPNEITPLDALERMFRWTMNKNKWVQSNAGVGNGVFRAFYVPFGDLEALFLDRDVEVIYVLLGLCVDPTEFPDLLLWNEITNFAKPSTMVADVTHPVPPFGMNDPDTNYQILLQSE